MKSIIDKMFDNYLTLHILLFFYSLGGICSKLAGGERFFSFKFCLFYGLVVFILAVYAVAWQQVLKNFELSTAFSNKAVTVIWGMVFGSLLFNEKITWNMIVGAVIVIFGVIMVVKSDE